MKEASAFPRPLPWPEDFLDSATWHFALTLNLNVQGQKGKGGGFGCRSPVFVCLCTRHGPWWSRWHRAGVFCGCVNGVLIQAAEGAVLRAGGSGAGGWDLVGQDVGLSLLSWGAVRWGWPCGRKSR